MYSDAYGMAVSEDLLNSAVDRATELAERTAGMDLATVAFAAVRRLFCPCVCTGSGCDCLQRDHLTDAIVQEVAARAKARLAR